MRLGELLTGEDQWWNLRPGTDVEELGRAVGDAVERYGLPWLDEMSDTETYLDTFIANLADQPSQHLYATECIAQVLGRPDVESQLAAERDRRDDNLRRNRD